MTSEELKKEFEGFNSKFDDRLNDWAKKWDEASNDRKAQKEIVEKVKAEFKEHQELTKKMQEHIDALDLKLQKGSFGGQKKHRIEQMIDFMKASAAFKSLQEGNATKQTFAELGEIMSIKADDMTQANSFESTAVVLPDQVPGIFYNPVTTFRVRNLLPVGVTNSNAVQVVREYAYSDGTAIKAEGSEYGQSDFDLKMTSATVYKITAYMIVSEEMLEDVDGLASYIYSRLPQKIAVKENDQLLYGTGSSEISGLSTNATAYSDNLALSTVTLIDVLADAVRQVKDDEYMPTAILLHPADVTKYLLLAKESTYGYIAPWIFSGTMPVIAGVPVIETTAITEGTFFVGDFARAAQVFDRRQNTIEITNSNEDNFIKGMMTIRGAERLALAIYRPSAFIYGSIAAALAQGSA